MSIVSTVAESASMPIEAERDVKKESERAEEEDDDDEDKEEEEEEEEAVKDAAESSSDIDARQSLDDNGGQWLILFLSLVFICSASSHLLHFTTLTSMYTLTYIITHPLHICRKHFTH